MQPNGVLRLVVGVDPSDAPPDERGQAAAALRYPDHDAEPRAVQAARHRRDVAAARGAGRGAPGALREVARSFLVNFCQILSKFCQILAKSS